MPALTLDSTPASVGAALVALAAGFDEASLQVQTGALAFEGQSSGVLAALAAAKKPALLGATDAERKAVADWIATLATEKDLPSKLDAALLTSTFLAPTSFQPTIADYAAWALVREAAAEGKLLNLARWSRYVVASVPRNAATAAWVKVPLTSAELPKELQSRIAELDLAAAAAADGKLRSAPVVAGKPAAAATAPAKNVTAAAPAAASAPAPAAKEGAADKKEKKEKAPKPAKAAAPAAAEVAQVYRVDFRVGVILSVAPHPTEARMFVLQVDVGAASGGVRTVVSGLAEHFTAEALANARVVCMCNLKAGDLKGVVSAGRLMVATDAATGKKELATPPAAASIGEKITFATVPADKAPDAELAPKRLHEILKGLKTSAAKTVQYDGSDFLTTAGPVTVETVAEGTVA